jgi:hypothetical protein
LNIALAAVTMSEMEEDFEQPLEDTIDGEAEVVDALPVLAEVRPIEPAAPVALPAAQAAAVAATGFVAGAATVALVRRRAARRAAEALSSRIATGGWPVGGTRTFLVHVRVIGRSAE